jgi:hypothetical protein
MSAWLNTLGIAVLALGIAVGAYAGTLAVADTAFAEVAAQYARHPENWAVQAEYFPAAARHYGLIGGSIGAIVSGLVFGSLLLGLATLVGRRPEEPETKKAG